MANELQVFTNPAFGQVHGIEIEGKPWFIGSEVASILKYTNPQKAIRDHVREKHKLTERFVLSGQNRKIILIDEAGLYSLVLRSKLPQAEEFQEWVTSEVLPAIRKHGGYLTPEKLREALLNPDTIIQLASKLKAEQERSAALEQRVDRLKRDHDFIIEKRNNTTAAVMVRKRNRSTANDYTITELADEYDLSAKKLRDVLKEAGWLKQVDGKGFHYPTLKAPEGALYVEQSSYFSCLNQTVRITPYGVLCIKQLLKDCALLPWYM